MLYSKAQVDAMVKAVDRGEELKLLVRLEQEVRKAYHSTTAAEFNGAEVEHLLTQLDVYRADRS